MNINSIIIEAIEEEKQTKVNEYDELIKSIENETNIAKLYYALSKAYKNTRKQGEIQIEFLKKHLKNDFFKKATISNQVNFIDFEDDIYKIRFSKSFDRRIEIFYKNIKDLSEPRLYENINHDHLIFHKLLEDYMYKKSLAKLKKLIIFTHYNEPKNIFKKIQAYIYGYIQYNDNFMKEIERQKQEYEKTVKEYELKLEKYNNTIKDIENFIESLTDLKPFIEAGFWIKTNIVKKGINLTIR